ncbi:hypothetical protein K1719_046115 [Acacia pycnantha]|nr:hypothetical protein K1719_046115 [Acacia pycnantha]
MSLEAYSDTRAIATLLHQYNGFACFDFAAGGPYMEIDMRSGQSDGYDAVFLSPHKFLGGPGSPNLLFMNKSLHGLRSSLPSTCGGGTVSYVNGLNEKDTLYLESIEERENGGTSQIIRTVRAALAFWVKEYIGYKEIEKSLNKCHSLAIRSAVEEGYVEVKSGWTRVSFSYYMSQDDFEFILTAMEFLGQTTYHFYDYVKFCQPTFSDRPSAVPVSMNGFNNLHTHMSPKELYRRDEEEEGEEDLWAKMQEEARFDIEQEPILSSYYHASILCYQSLEIALANHLSLKLCSSSLPSRTLIDVFISILNENEEIMGAVKYDLRTVKGGGLRQLLPVRFQ